MKIIRLGVYETSEVKPNIYINNRGEKFYNVRHGKRGNPEYCWGWVCSIDSKIATPVSDPDFKLIGNDYEIEPIFKNGKPKKDKLGNIEYVIKKDNSSFNKDDILTLWELPSKKYTDIEYELVGEVTEIGKGTSCMYRQNSIISTPAPVLEITGDCTLSWVGKYGGKKYKQVISYSSRYREWKFNVIEVVG